ncbi:hypothetical protein ACLOJK_015416 [Asimina triloba]
MKQKTVIRVEMNSQKCRTKAMQIAATTKGASSVSIEGKERDEVVVIGDGVDPIKLTRSMRKKVGHAELISVQEVKQLKDGRKESKMEGGGGGGPWKSDYNFGPDYRYQHVVRYEPFYDPNPNTCSVM